VSLYSDAWYELVDGTELRQGDLFRDLLVVDLPPDLPLIKGDPPDELALKAQFRRGTFIVLTASCDLDNRRVQGTLLAAAPEATEAVVGASGDKEYRQRLEVVRRGLDPSKFLLSDCPLTEPPLPLSIVFFRQQHFLPIGYLEANCTGPRLRLRPPFREQFGNWVGARFANVGVENPDQIPPIVERIFTKHILDAVEE
jgi:hypothetical protein